MARRRHRLGPAPPRLAATGRQAAQSARKRAGRCRGRAARNAGHPPGGRGGARYLHGDLLRVFNARGACRARARCPTSSFPVSWRCRRARGSAIPGQYRPRRQSQRADDGRGHLPPRARDAARTPRLWRSRFSTGAGIWRQVELNSLFFFRVMSDGQGTEHPEARRAAVLARPGRPLEKLSMTGGSTSRPPDGPCRRGALTCPDRRGRIGLPRHQSEVRSRTIVTQIVIHRKYHRLQNEFLANALRIHLFCTQ
jgi:hypothetical protein